MAPFSYFDDTRERASGRVLSEETQSQRRYENASEKCRLIQNILERINDFIVHGNLVMKMRSGRKPPRAADQAQQVSPFHLLAVPNENFGKMTVGRFDSMPMIDSNIIAHSRVIGCPDHFTFGGSPYLFPSRGTDIQARMERPFSGKWRNTWPKL